jgi:hypothetical protein
VGRRASEPCGAWRVAVLLPAAALVQANDSGTGRAAVQSCGIMGAWDSAASRGGAIHPSGRPQRVERPAGEAWSKAKRLPRNLRRPCRPRPRQCRRDLDRPLPCRPLRLFGSHRRAVAEHPSSVRVDNVVTVACGVLESVRINDHDSATSLFDEVGQRAGGRTYEGIASDNGHRIQT